MNATEWITLALVILNIIYVSLVFWQTKRLKELTLKQIRYLVEGDITQIRLKRAEFLHKEGKKTEQKKTEHKKSPMDILNERECQCTKTVNRIEAELQCSFLQREIEKLRGKKNGQSKK